ncbi:D-3-phosphoglycerate dehydrogenase (EC 1.1.1.95) [Azospirillum argentinense]|uniref:2-hydroxyacid dehydrogenase n=1 Tax=Azospirillum argentinense TaxID=2970906 RepID=UPI0032E021EB
MPNGTSQAGDRDGVAPPPHPLRVVIADANFVPHRALMEARLPAGSVVSWHPAFDEAAVAADLAGADVFVGPRFTAAMGAAADSLRLVHVGGAGYDGIDTGALPDGAVCANTFCHESSIAEYVAATSVVMRRQFLQQDRALRTGHWASSVYESQRCQLNSLAGATVGIVGYGHIGSRTWQLMRAFGATGVTVTPRPVDVEREGLRWAAGIDGLGRLLAESDVVVLCLPLRPDTRHMIDAARLAAMKPDALLVNVSRGPLVDPEALYDALKERRIGGAVIDVWYQYPAGGAHAQPSPLPFASLDNVLMTPHISGVTRQTFEGRVQDIAANIGRLAAGEPLRNVVFPR